MPQSDNGRIAVSDRLILRRDRPGSLNTRFARFGNSADRSLSPADIWTALIARVVFRPHCVRAKALLATQHREAITVLPNFSDLGLSTYPWRRHRRRLRGAHADCRRDARCPRRRGGALPLRTSIIGSASEVRFRSDFGMRIVPYRANVRMT